MTLDASEPQDTPQELTGLIFEQVNASIDITVQATESGDLIRFKNAILARAETNKNNDVISADNIQELSDTLAGWPIDIGHDQHANAGVITAARPVVYKGLPAVAIDGLLWRDRYPDEIDGVKAGTHLLSVEALADRAVCSSCQGQFIDASTYCEHLRARRRSGAKRGFIGLKGRGAGITENPAGSETRFDLDKIFVVAHQENAIEEDPTDSPAGATIAQSLEEHPMLKCPRCEAEMAVEAETCPTCGKSVSATVIAAELKASETELSAASVQLQAKSAELTQALADLETLKAEKAGQDAASQAESQDQQKKLEAALVEAQKRIDDAVAEATQVRTALAAAEEKVAAARNHERETLVKPYLTEAAWAERAVKFFAMDDDTFNTVAASLQETAKKPAQAFGLRSGMPDQPVAGSGANHAGDAKRTLTVRPVK